MWMALKNFGLIYDFAKLAYSVLIEKIVKGKSLPECQQSLELVKSLRVLLEKKIFIFPAGMDTDAICKALKDLEERVVCKS